MKNVLALALTTAGLFTSSLSAPFPPTPSGTVWCFIARVGPPIVASTPGTPVTGLQLAVDITPATLETTGFTGGYTLTNGGIGAFEGCHNWWLNIGTSAKSYKPLSWAFDDQVTTNWAVTAGSPISAAATASYSATSSFLVCKEVSKWRVYLQTGTDKPAGLNCTTTELVLQAS